MKTTTKPRTSRLDLSHLGTDPYRLSAKSPPRLRGQIHFAMIIPSILAGVWLIIEAPDAGSTAVAAIYAFTLTAMFSLSSLFHLGRWSDRSWWQFRKLDHTGIYLLIAGSYLAIAGTSLEGYVRIGVLAASWGLIAITLLLRWLPFVPVKGSVNAVFIGIGWISVGAMKWFWESLGVVGIVLLLTGGFFYTAGAIVLGARKPNPSPKYFGYHEVWHVATVVGVVCHFLVVAIVIY